MMTSRQTTPDALQLECTHCHVAMTPAPQGESRVRYFCCPSCHQWASTMYSDAVRLHAGARELRPSSGERVVDFEAVKRRMAAWTERLEREDPYAALGVHPASNTETIRERYRELAHQHHPDRGGSTAEMSRVNDAYERIRRRQA